MKNTYFVSDVHLGLNVGNPADREARFVRFLKKINTPETEALYMLGDIWDFWYEYKDVVPKGYIRVLGALMDLMDAGIKVYFFQGNHDVWTYHYFEQLGMTRLTQPSVVTIGGVNICMGHGDALGKTPIGYRLMRWAFHNKVLQALFSMLHPRIAFALGNGWSKHNRLARKVEYIFLGKDEPIARFANEFALNYEKEHEGQSIDFFVFGHYHCDVLLRLECGSELYMLKDWIGKSPYAVFDGTSLYKETME